MGALGDGIDERIEVESRQIRILSLDVHYRGCVIPDNKVVNHLPPKMKKKNNILTKRLEQGGN